MSSLSYLDRKQRRFHINEQLEQVSRENNFWYLHFWLMLYTLHLNRFEGNVLVLLGDLRGLNVCSSSLVQVYMLHI